MQQALILIGFLFLITLVIALMFMRRRDDWEGAPVEERVALPPISCGRPELVAQSASEKAFRAWLAVLYQDNPRYVEEVVADVAVRLHERGVAAGEFPVDEVMAVGAGEAVGAEHAFAVYPDDRESLTACLHDMAARFRFLPVLDEAWSNIRPGRLPAMLFEQFMAHNGVLYHAKTDGSFYFLMIVPKRDIEDFECAAREWGMKILFADRSFD